MTALSTPDTAESVRTERPAESELEGLSLAQKPLLDAAWDAYESARSPWSPRIEDLSKLTGLSPAACYRNAEMLRQRNLWPGVRRPKGGGALDSPQDADRAFRKALLKGKESTVASIPLRAEPSAQPGPPPKVGPRCWSCRSIKPSPTSRCPACKAPAARPTPGREELVARPKPKRAAATRQPAPAEQPGWITRTEALQRLGMKGWNTLNAMILRGDIRKIEIAENQRGTRLSEEDVEQIKAQRAAAPVLQGRKNAQPRGFTRRCKPYIDAGLLPPPKPPRTAPAGGVSTEVVSAEPTPPPAEAIDQAEPELLAPPPVTHRNNGPVTLRVSAPATQLPPASAIDIECDAMRIVGHTLAALDEPTRRRVIRWACTRWLETKEAS